MNKPYTLYEHIFPDGKRYIGITCQAINARWKNGHGYETQSKVYEAIQKYGWDNIQHVVLQTDLTKEEAEILERQKILEFNSIENGYNISVGGIDKSGEKLYEYNNEFLTASELADKYGAKGVDGHAFTNRVNCRGWSVERALHQEVEERDGIYVFNNISYTLDDIFNMQKTPLTKQDILNRLQHGWDLERIISQPKGVKKQPFGIVEPTFEYKGKLYNSYQLSQLSPYDDITPANIICRINHHGWSVERAINTPKKNKDIKIKYNGKMYSTKELAELNPDPKVTHHTVTDRLKGGWSVKEIVEVPIGITRKRFYNL